MSDILDKHIEEIKPSPDPVPRNFDKQYNLAKQICEGKAGGHYFYLTEEDSYYHFQDGYWKKIFENELIKSIGEHPLEVKSRGTIQHVSINNWPISYRQNIIKNIQYINNKRLEELNQKPFINLKNCMFDPLELKSIPHDKNLYSTIRVPFEYDESAKCPLWSKTLNEIFEANQKKLDLFQEFIGYCLLPDILQKKALLLLGESNSGKSTILFIIKDLIGEVNCSNVPLQNLSDPQYTPMLINKLVNIDADVSKNAENYEREFKIITSGEPVNCNQKYVPSFSFIPRCKIILAANIFPKITDHSSAFYNRLLLIPCERIFREEQQDKNLRSKLNLEMPGIFNWAIEGLKRFKTRGSFEQHDFMKKAVKELEDDNNPSNIFFDEHIEVDISDGIFIAKSELFEKYKQWCIKNNYGNLSHIKFSRALFKRFHAVTQKDAQDGTSGLRIWRNIRYIHERVNAEQVEINDEG